MRLSLVPPFLSITLTLAAASPWDAFLQRCQGQDPRTARWIVGMRSGDLGGFDALGDEVLQKLVLGGDLGMVFLGPAEAKDLWAQQSWSEKPYWVLINPEGALATTGMGQPKGDAVLAAITQAGGVPRFQARAAFLRDHPEQGEAWLEEVGLSFRLMRNRLTALDRQGKVQVPAWHQAPGAPTTFAYPRLSLPPGPEGEALADTLYADTAKSLVKLFAVPGWTRSLPAVTAQLTLWDLSQGSAMRSVFSQAHSTAEALVRQDPEDYEVANFWMESGEAAGLAPSSLGGAVSPVPGRLWPSPAILSRLVEPWRRRQDWGGVLRGLSDLAPFGPPEPLSARGWLDYSRLQCAIGVQKAGALAGQGSWDLAAGALEAAREAGGAQGLREALLLRGSQWAGPAAEQVNWRNTLNQALSRPGARPPVPALAPPLRLVLLGSPRWVLAWSALNHAPELAPWSPGELRWEAASRDTHEHLRRQFQWEQGPRWALFRGDDLRATGVTCPPPQALAATLEGEGPTELQALQRVLSTQPDHAAAHRARFELLLQRMPDARLEATLAQDAAAARIALPFAPTASWKPDPDLWAAAAQSVLPKVEDELRSWPSRSALWTVWISWARFHPSRPSLLNLAQSLPYWYPQGDWRAGLPYQVQRAVAAELRLQGSFDTMRSWFRSAWEVLDHRPLAVLRIGERQWVQERRREEETAIFLPLREALRALGCTEEQAELERVFNAMMGREAIRR
jgi:hypothetical protein